MENIQDSSSEPTKISQFTSDIDCILVKNSLNTIMVGDRYGRVAQYKFDLKDESIKLVKDYGILGIRYIYSGSIMGNLAVFGGYQSSSMVIIDIVKHQVFGKPIETAVQTIQSVQFCFVSESQILLAVSGIYSNYSDSQTDLFDASDLLIHHILKIQEYMQRRASDSEMSLSQKSNSDSKKSRSRSPSPKNNSQCDYQQSNCSQEYSNPNMSSANMDPVLVKVEDYISTLFGTLIYNMEMEDALNESKY